MDRVINISDRTNSALHALALFAAAEHPMTSAEAASQLQVSPTYLAKTLQPLVKAGLLASTRGAAGGFILARDPACITCHEVMEILDGPVAARDCLFETAICERKVCVLSALYHKIESEVASVFRSTTIAALAASFDMDTGGVPPG